MDLFESFQDAYLNLREANNIEREIITLKSMKITLKQSSDEGDLEEEFLSLAVQNLGEDLSDPFPHHKVEDILYSQDEMNFFIFYVLERRFGWSEGIGNAEVTSQITKGINVEPAPSVLCLEKEARLKGQLNSLLDEFLKWFLCQKISKPLLCSFRNAISKGSNRPVVRHQTIIHLMEWLQCNASDACFHNNWSQVQELIVCGLTDIWSAIRNACVTRLGPIVENVTLVKLEAFYIVLCKICQNSKKSWQSIEGAIMAVNSILKRFQWVGRLPYHSFSDNTTYEAKYYLKFGHEELSQLPRFLSDSLHSLIYPLLAHPQLSVREQATKAFASFLSRCEFQEALSSFKEAVSRLAQGTRFTEMLSADSLPPEFIRYLPHTAVVKEGYQFMDAYEAEGLIGVCVNLIKHIPPKHLLEKWSLYFSVFNIYLMHPASTVRQVTSTLLKYLVAKSTNNAVLLKLILQSLVAHWVVNVDDLATFDPRYYKKVRLQLGRVRKSVQSPPQNNNTEERVEALPSITTCSNNEGGPGDASVEERLAQTWEWREGRLLTYELIAKLLVLNHVHYLVPPYAVHHPRFRATVSTDGAVQTRQSKAMGTKAANTKSLSHGGQSLRQAWVAQGTYNRMHSQEDTETDSSSSSTPFTSPREQSKDAENHDGEGLKRTGSVERRKRSLEDRRSRTLAEGTFYNQPIPKHYSFPEGSKPSPSHSPKRRSSAFLVSSSLLCLVRDWELSHSTKENNGDMSKVKIPFPHWRNSVRNGKEDVIKEKWSGQSYFPGDGLENQEARPFTELVPAAKVYQHMFLQTIECLGSPQWELRRMGQQALSILTDNIRWFDFTILTHLFDQFFTPDSTLMTYGLSLAVKASLIQAVKLQHFAESQGKEADACSEIPLSIIASVQESIPYWLEVARQLVHRTVIDRLTVVALDIILRGYNNFTEFIKESKQRELEICVVTCIFNVFSHAHPGHAWSRHLIQMEQALSEMEAVSSGYLSCLKGDSIQRLPQHIEKALLVECHCCIPSFLIHCPLSHSIQLLPIFLHLLSVFQEEYDITKSLLDGCMVLVSSLEKAILFSGDALTSEFTLSLEYALRGIIDVIVLKNLELSILRQVLEMYILVSQHVSTTGHLVSLFKGLQSRLEIIDDVFDRSRSSEPRVHSGLAYFSNDIPASPVDSRPISDDEDDNDSGQCHPLAESLSLNASGGSGQHRLSISERASLSPIGPMDDEDEDSDSDWDSWEDEDEDQAALQDSFGDFLRRLQGHYRETSMPGESSVFEVQLNAAGEQNTKTVRRLLGI